MTERATIENAAQTRIFRQRMAVDFAEAWLARFRRGVPAS